MFSPLLRAQLARRGRPSWGAAEEAGLLVSSGRSGGHEGRGRGGEWAGQLLSALKLTRPWEKQPRVCRGLLCSPTVSLSPLPVGFRAFLMLSPVHFPPGTPPALSRRLTQQKLGSPQDPSGGHLTTPTPTACSREGPRCRPGLRLVCSWSTVVFLGLPGF